MRSNYRGLSEAGAAKDVENICFELMQKCVPSGHAI